MLDRKIYQLCQSNSTVSIFLRDQMRWIDRATILNIEGDIVTLRYEVEDEDEIFALEEAVRLDSIGSVSRQIASVPKYDTTLLVSEDCPDEEK
ncbi:DUF6679 family protein [Synechococcus sp. PCC 7336]|uniref:DUF6679 family protein n=1 Tax=Synechococcus sp. PCC 7336 TaxID=195250 RepID=UPI0003466D1C|nr:DUF6679 family protein [Synechococcus sp. PCC 7336]